MKQQPLLGFLFALITAMAWGSLPIALKQVLSVMTPQNDRVVSLYCGISSTLYFAWLQEKITTIFERWPFYLACTHRCSQA